MCEKLSKPDRESSGIRAQAEVVTRNADEKRASERLQHQSGVRVAIERKVSAGVSDVVKRIPDAGA